VIKIKKPSKKVLVVILASLVVLGAGATSYWFLVRDSSSNVPGNGSGEPPVNLEPATEEDQQRADDNKQRIVDQAAQVGNQQGNSSSKKNVAPIITYSGQYGSVVEVGAEVAVFENSGTCIAVFTLGGSKVTRSVQAIQNVNRMSCPVMSVPVSELNPKGEWTVVVSYDSGTTVGASNPSKFRVE